MPYIKEDQREELDPCIDNLIKCLDPEKDLMIDNILGDINYTFSRILGGLMGTLSYNKIAMITGVLENIKQEFYRRVAQPYEDLKIRQNGDIPEYKKF